MAACIICDYPTTDISDWTPKTCPWCGQIYVSDTDGKTLLLPTPEQADALRRLYVEEIGELYVGSQQVD